jgi:hypothetical protein
LLSDGHQSFLRRAWGLVAFPPPHPGPVLDGRVDAAAYLVAWIVTLAHLALALCVFLLGLDRPWPVVSAVASGLGTIILLTLVIVIHRRMGERRALHRDLVWQWWLGPWDPVGRLIWLPVRLGEAWHTLTRASA